MTHSQRLSHYLTTAQQLRAAGRYAWAKVYAKKAVRLMEGK